MLLYIFFAIFTVASLKLVSWQHKQITTFRARLKRIEATDDEVIAILEATDSDLARKLLAYANTKALPQRTTLVRAKRSRIRYVMSEEWRAIKREILASKSEDSKIDVVKDWLSKGYRFSPGQRSAMMQLFMEDVTRARARLILGEEEANDRKGKGRS